MIYNSISGQHAFLLSVASEKLICSECKRDSRSEDLNVAKSMEDAAKTVSIATLAEAGTHSWLRLKKGSGATLLA
jgi:hypothetical protein